MTNSKPSLMIVDDESSLRTTLCQIFAQRGYSVRSAADGFAALALIQERVPDILLSDLNMPGMSGFELLSVVRRIHPAIHVIATSSAFSGENVPYGIAADAFYGKATGLSFLFQMMEQGSPCNRVIQRSSDEATPVWMSPTGTLPSNDLYVLMVCPRCLRAFPKVLGGKQQIIHETKCLYCDAIISYAIAPIVEASKTYDSFSSSTRNEIDSISMRFDSPFSNRQNSN